MSTESPELALARRGFLDGAAAAAHLARLEGIDDALVEQVAAVASPDTALSSLVAIAESWGIDRLLTTLRADDELRQRLLIVLGTSEALGDFLARHPEHVEDLGADRLSPVPLDLATMREQLGEVADERFSRLFFGIWLSPKTSQPAMRETLLQGLTPLARRP